MAVQSVVNIFVTKTGLANGGSVNVPVPAYINSDAPEAGVVTQSFSAGVFAAVTIPSGSTSVLITIPDDNANTVTQKGATGDTGTIVLTTGGRTWPMPLGTGAALGFLCADATTISFLFT